ncbi:exodeoxyribonuclease VII large subunit [Oceanivirga miroungae]|uniref:Exodeoxyribonuclease 7 large subunit n=1 Tax=Oceanivirga miroungae TaxID=1130046 RepID=A0A6I8MCC5_9FUSO|nr:exodeoxyribonuclease VII large subunit [Oceanivirga miroungae]VWL84816.1 exodeoxyribonuclease VII large subunit [Oceanivirga miroungae]
MQILKIAELNTMIKEYLESNSLLRFICVEGEASNVKYQQRHLYFTLKDKDASINCAAFNYSINNIPLDIKEGDKIKVFGNVNVYKANASVQIVSNKIEKANKLGDLYVKREELIKLYEKKGYFDKSIKKTLPLLPQTIGIVSSHTGAAIHDIINTTHKRNPNVTIYIYSAKVQGDGASTEIANGIRYFNSSNLNIDCIIVGRGGGSIEDLWAFNEVEVIEAIHESNIPIISAVGHEVDILISDYVADVRASTPTQAAEILVPLKSSLIDNLNNLKSKCNKALLNTVDKNKYKLNLLKENYQLKQFYSIQILEKINLLEKLKLDLKKELVHKLSTKDKRMELALLNNKFNTFINLKLQNSKNTLNNLATKLEKFDNSDILNRGYTITLKDGKIIKNADIKKGDKLKTIYSGNKTIESVVE